MHVASVFFCNAANRKLKTPERAQWFDKRSSCISRMPMDRKLWGFIKGSDGAWYPKGFEERVRGGIDQRRHSRKTKSLKGQRRGQDTQGRSEGVDALGTKRKHPSSSNTGTGGTISQSSFPSESLQGTPSFPRQDLVGGTVSENKVRVMDNSNKNSRQNSSLLKTDVPLLDHLKEEGDETIDEYHKERNISRSASHSGSSHGDGANIESISRYALSKWFARHLELIPKHLNLKGSAEAGDLESLSRTKKRALPWGPALAKDRNRRLENLSSRGSGGARLQPSEDPSAPTSPRDLNTSDMQASGSKEMPQATRQDGKGSSSKEAALSHEHRIKKEALVTSRSMPSTHDKQKSSVHKIESKPQHPIRRFTPLEDADLFSTAATTTVTTAVTPSPSGTMMLGISSSSKRAGKDAAHMISSSHVDRRDARHNSK